MATRRPERGISRLEDYLESYQGTSTYQCRQLLVAFWCSVDIPVKTFTYHDGELVMKYRVSVKLPHQLGLPLVMPFGEGRSHIAAFHIVVGEAISLTREHKATSLEGTSYMAIPHDSVESEEVLDHVELFPYH